MSNFNATPSGLWVVPQMLNFNETSSELLRARVLRDVGGGLLFVIAADELGELLTLDVVDRLHGLVSRAG